MAFSSKYSVFSMALCEHLLEHAKRLARENPRPRLSPKTGYNRGMASFTVVLVNPRSGAGDALHLARAAQAVWQAHGWETYLVVPPHPLGFTLAARLAGEKAAARVVVVGGDGTVRWAARGLMGTHVPLGLLPAGTGNVLARYLGLPAPGPVARKRTAQRAAERLLQAAPRPWDLFQVNGALGVLWLGLGLDAAVVARVEALRKTHQGRPLVRTWLRFVHAALGGILANGAQTVQVTTETQRARWHARMLVVANVPLYAGGLIRFPQGRPDDGRLEVWVLPWRPPGDLVKTALGLVLRHGLPIPWPGPGISARQVHLRPARPWLAHCDGDPLPPADHLEVRLLPGTFFMLVPQQKGPNTRP